MKRFGNLIALAFALIAAAALFYAPLFSAAFVRAQGGLIAPGDLLGNGTTSPRSPLPTPITSAVDQGICGTDQSFPVRVNGKWICSKDASALDVYLSGVDQNFPASGNIVGTTDTQTLNNKTIFSPDITGHPTVEGVTSTGATGTGNFVFSNSPTLTTPTIGLATATSVNKLAITAPSSGATLTIANGKTLTADNSITLAGTDGKTLTTNNSITLAGTDGTTWTGPASSASLAALDLSDQTVSGGANVTALAQPTGNITVDCGARSIQTITNNGAYTITAPSSDGFCLLKVTNGASAGATTFSGFSVGSNTGDPLDTTSGHKFIISIIRAGGDSTYSVKALQ